MVNNPWSGRKGLYVASQNTMWIEGMDRDESEKLLETMFELWKSPDHLRARWRVGDFLVWDNLACLHARTDWPAEQKRTLRRCTTEGEPLYYAPRGTAHRIIDVGADLVTPFPTP